MLSLYARMFSTIEVSSSFYTIPAAPVLRAWRDRVPDDFLFALKAPQQVTHTKRLVNADGELDRFVERVRELETALGPVLVLLPPDFLPSPENVSAFEDFVAHLPGDIRWSVEFRHPAWLTDDTLDVLREANVGLTLVDGRWLKRSTMLELLANPTADFCYVRWMGPGRKTNDLSRPQDDREADLAAWADALATIPERVNMVYGYFNNQFQGHGPHSVREMQRLLGQQPMDPVVLRR
jgi:uncharacterized protein YecE (DUF72 family)